LSFFEADERTFVGHTATGMSSYVMNGGTILYDDPFGGQGMGLGNAGVNENDLEIGAQGPGVFEMHNDAVLRISDDLKIGAEANGDGMVLIDGDAVVSVGSGISVSEAANSQGVLIVGGNALVESGNSAGAGNTEEGYSDEGYFTLSTQGDPANESLAEVIFRDNATVNVRTLQQRGSTTTLTIEDNAQFHIFDVFNGSGPETGAGSHMAQEAFSDFTITLTDNAVMTVDSNLSPAGAGLIMSAGRNGDNTNAGGTSRIEVLDDASFTIEQDLRMAVGIEASSTATFAKAGTSTATINGDLLMAVDDVGGDLTGDGQTATLEFILNGEEFDPLTVGGTAYLGNGQMSLVLDGFNPTGGEMFELLQAGTIDGEFLSVDTAMAPLAEGLSWEVSYSATAVLLEVMGESALLMGDYNGNGQVEQGDLDLVLLNWGQAVVPGGWTNDLPDGAIDQAELDGVLLNWGNASGQLSAAGAVPEPTTLLIAMLACAGAAIWRRTCRRHLHARCI
jgi:hypothetical protein